MNKYEFIITVQTDGMDGPNDLIGMCRSIEHAAPSLVVKYVNVVKPIRVVGRYIPEEKTMTATATAKPAAKPARKKITLLKFTASWCGPCNAAGFLKAIHDFAAAHPEVTVKTIDVDTRDPAKKKLIKKYDVQSVPTMVWLVNGKVAVDSRGNGMAPEKKNNGKDTRGLAGLNKIAEGLR